jgi:Starch-binding associating with outer membrane
MKKISFLLLMLLAVLSGCKDFLDINTDPTRPSDATVQQLLPVAIFYTSEAHYYQSYIACQYVQQIGSATGNNPLDAQFEADNGTGWTHCYLNVIPQLDVIIKKAQEQSLPAYSGIAKVLMAYNLGIATTAWENVPYSQADQLNFSPEYDTQEQIYGSIQKLLDEAIASLQQSGSVKPSTDDLIYQGDLSKWTRLAYTLKARYAMHLSKKGAVQAANTALAALQNGMKSNADDFQLYFNSRNLAPWYSRVALANNTGNLSVTFGATFINFMNKNEVFKTSIIDPRLPLIATLNKNQTEYNGTRPGANQGATTTFTTAGWYSKDISPLQFVTYAEAKALEAEARFIANGGTKLSTGSTPESYAAYLEIAKANMSKLGVATAASDKYLTEPLVVMGATKLTLNDIMREKYKAMFLNGDIWNDFRRYDNLFLQLPENMNVNLQGKWIQRMNYPTSETARNSAVALKNFKTVTEPMWAFK